MRLVLSNWIVLFLFGFFELFRLNEAIVANFAYEPLGE